MDRIGALLITHNCSDVKKTVQTDRQTPDYCFTLYAMDAANVINEVGQHCTLARTAKLVINSMFNFYWQYSERK